MRNFLVWVCILLLLAMIGWKVSESWREEREANQKIVNTSDAKTIEHYLKVTGDEWLGYLIFRSPKFQSKLEEKRIALEFVIEPDFQKRFEMLADGRCDFVCATIDSFLVNGRSTDYPGVIVFGIDESYGGDAIIAKKPLENLDDLKAEGLTGAFVGYSPSEFLLKSQIAHFGIEELKPKMDAFRTDDAQTAYRQLKTGDADFAVLWEPFVSRALREIPEATRLMDTKQARGVVYDVAIASRSLIAEQPQLVQQITDAYFEALNDYLSAPASFKKLAQKDSGESSADAEAMLGGIRFLNLLDNREMSKGTRDIRMTDAVSNITQILLEVGDLASDPLRGNPRLVINSRFIEQTTQSLASNAASGVKPIKRFFSPLTEVEWKRLYSNRSGTLLERPVTFGVGQSTIPAEFESELKSASQKLIHYPGHRVIVQAHVSPGSDPQLDRELSQERADVIREFLIAEAGVSPDRVYAVGVGGDEPVVRADGEGLRSWKRRCRRARIFLAEES